MMKRILSVAMLLAALCVAAPPAMAVFVVRVGDTVYVRGMGQRGELLSAPDAHGEAEVQVGSLKLRVNAADLDRLSKRQARANETPLRIATPTRSPEEAPDLQLDLRGWRVEDALEEVPVSDGPQGRSVQVPEDGVVREALASEPPAPWSHLNELTSQLPPDVDPSEVIQDRWFGSPGLFAAPPIDGGAGRAAREKAWRRERRHQRYAEVVERQQRGESQRQIAAATGLSRATVARYLTAGAFPEIARRVTAAPIAPYLPALRQRWAAGGRNGRRLWEEIVAQGFPGPPAAVYRAIAPWRAQLPPGERRSRRQPHGEAAPGAPTPSPRAAAWWLIGRKQPVTAEQAAIVERWVAQCPEVKTAQELAQGFFRLVRKREGEGLEAWTRAVAASGIRELEQFCAGLRRDWDAVVAALTLPWSNGPVEGEINRLKLIKRQMYGRAGLGLLRARVLSPG